ncbi:MAG: NAD(P)H-binding protein [Actinomycetota bacterium]|jgi:putative NADH-flavin reductase|nr:NAD(P)H-binding protein [Actinomycetota bacterium]
MRITVFGATGSVGGRVVAEALARGHEVTAVARDPAGHELPAAANPRAGDAADVEDVVELSAGQDLVIAATRPAPGDERGLVRTTKALLAGLAQTGVRLLVSGGAGSLTVPGAGGRTVMDDPNFLSLGTDEMLVDADGNSTISIEDLAVALLDEAERPKHHQTRFTIAA